MISITLFEHQKRAYPELRWDRDQLAFEQIERLNECAGAQQVQHLKATYLLVVILGWTTCESKLFSESPTDPGARPKPVLADARIGELSKLRSDSCSTYLCESLDEVYGLLSPATPQDLMMLAAFSCPLDIS